MMRYHRALPVALTAGTLTAVLLSAGACSSGPTSKDDVCAGYDELGKQYAHGNGIIGNPLFHKAGDLADVADRYEGEPSLDRDAKSLKAIADSDSTDGFQLANATTTIAQLCGHSFASNTIFGP